MSSFLSLNLIGRIQALLILLTEAGDRAQARTFWLFMGLIEAGLRTGYLTEMEYQDLESRAAEIMAGIEGAV